MICNKKLGAFILATVSIIKFNLLPINVSQDSQLVQRPHTALWQFLIS